MDSEEPDLCTFRVKREVRLPLIADDGSPISEYNDPQFMEDVIAGGYAIEIIG